MGEAVGAGSVPGDGVVVVSSVPQAPKAAAKLSTRARLTNFLFIHSSFANCDNFLVEHSTEVGQSRL